MKKNQYFIGFILTLLLLSGLFLAAAYYNYTTYKNMNMHQPETICFPPYNPYI